ncbi:hypothetical protein KY360_00665 [Candidatus Woesearchaeota archaeon]|nr:hypothetical protein [Candidatus Woesearchaeota archaeon]
MGMVKKRPIISIVILVLLCVGFFVFYYYVLDGRLEVDEWGGGSEFKRIVFSSHNKPPFLFNAPGFLKDCLVYGNNDIRECEGTIKHSSFPFALTNVIEKNLPCNELSNKRYKEVNFSKICSVLKKSSLVISSKDFHAIVPERVRDCNEFLTHNVSLYRLCITIKNETAGLNEKEFHEYVPLMHYLLNKKNAHDLQSHYSCYNKDSDYLYFFKIASCISKYKEAHDKVSIV